GAPHGGLRRGAETAVHRVRQRQGQGADPLRRKNGRPVRDLETARQPRGVPRGHGRRGHDRGGALPGQDRLYQRDEKSVGGLRLLCRGRGPLYETSGYCPRWTRWPSTRRASTWWWPPTTRGRSTSWSG